MKQRIAITGATGFVGRNVIPAIATAGYDVISLSRNPGMDSARQYDFNMPVEQLRLALKGCGSVIHLAARVHVMGERDAKDAMAANMVANCIAAQNLAIAAAEEGVRQFIFLSTAKVYGEESHEAPFVVGMPEAPQGPYANSKLKAEQALRELTTGNGLSLAIIRPPLIHGLGVKANLAQLARLARLPIPLPLGSIQNCRSLLGAENLASLLCALLARQDKSPLIVNASDGDDVSTTRLVRLLAKAQGQDAWLLPIPEQVLRGLLRAAGKASLARRLLNSFQIDIGATQALLNWKPVLSLADGLAQAFNGNGAKK